MGPLRRRFLPPLLPCLLLSACGAPERSTGQAPELLVLAASSLTDALPRAVAGWRGPGGARVRFGFDATSRLAPQLGRGAPADLFVSADETWMDWAEEKGLVVPGSRVELLRNELVVVTPANRRNGGPEAPSDTDGWRALRHLALAGENVPAGRYAREALERAGAWELVADRVIRGGSVRATLEWVAQGEVTAGVVYRTDARAEPRVRVAFAFPPGPGARVAYHAAITTDAPHPEAARALLSHLRGLEAGGVFEAAGFQRPAATEARPPRPVASPADPLTAVRLSLIVALAAVLLGLAPAVGVGWLLARRDFAGKSVLTTAVMVPLVLPPVVTGFVLLTLLGRSSPLGAVLADMGLPVPFTLLGAVVAALAVGLPLYVVAVRGAFEAVDHRLEEVSWTLGRAPRATFRRITLPLALPGIAAGAVLAFARALGEFGATVVLAGNVEGDTRTIALAVYTLLEAPGGQRATWILVGASVALSAAALLGYEALSRRQRRRVTER